MHASSGGHPAVDLLPRSAPRRMRFSLRIPTLKTRNPAVDRQRLRVDVDAPCPSPERTGFRTQSSSSIGDDNRNLLPSWGSLPRIPSDHLDAGLPGLERTKQGGGRRSDRTQHTAVIREHAGREDPQQLDGRSAFQKVPAGCPEHQYISHPHVQHGWEILARLNLDKVGQSVTAPVPRPLPRLPMATIRRRRPFQPGSMAQPHARPLDRCPRRTRGRWR
jgi:hypothetical protein